MPDYPAFARHLEGRTLSPVTLAFSELEAIVGSLPASARKYREWWANHACNSQAKGWLGAGWEVSSVSIGDERVVFSRLQRGQGSQPPIPAAPSSSRGRAAAFEREAREVLEARWDVELPSRTVQVGGQVEKSLDFVSADGRIVGDAKYYKTLKVPAGKWSTIAEYVWLLQHVDADKRLLIFGNDRDVPERWLRRFGPLAEDIDFFFLDDSGRLSNLRD